MSIPKRRVSQECSVRKAAETLPWSCNLTLTTGDSHWVSHRGFDNYETYSPSSMEHKYRRPRNHSNWNIYVIPIFMIAILIISIIVNNTYLASQRASNKPQNWSTKRESSRHQNQYSPLVDETHVEHLIERLRSIDGITLHEGRLYDVIAKSGGNLHEVTNTLKRLLSHDVPHEEKIFFMD